MNIAFYADGTSQKCTDQDSCYGDTLSKHKGGFLIMSKSKHKIENKGTGN